MLLNAEVEDSAGHHPATKQPPHKAAPHGADWFHRGLPTAVQTWRPPLPPEGLKTGEVLGEREGETAIVALMSEQD